MRSSRPSASRYLPSVPWTKPPAGQSGNRSNWIGSRNRFRRFCPSSSRRRHTSLVTTAETLPGNVSSHSGKSSTPSDSSPRQTPQLSGPWNPIAPLSTCVPSGLRTMPTSYSAIPISSSFSRPRSWMESGWRRSSGSGKTSSSTSPYPLPLPPAAGLSTSGRSPTSATRVPPRRSGSW